jgi:mono/diheme cytochrome c family protein
MGVYKCRSTPSTTLPGDSDLRRSVVDGLAGTGMPSFAALNPQEIDDLVETLKSLSLRFGKEPQGASIPIAAEPHDAASVGRGALVYDKMKCATCHGAAGEGGPGGANLHNDDGSKARATDFSRSHSVKCGDSPAQLFQTLMVGLDGTPMSGYGEAMTPDEAWDLVHFLKSNRR